MRKAIVASLTSLSLWTSSFAQAMPVSSYVGADGRTYTSLDVSGESTRAQAAEATNAQAAAAAQSKANAAIPQSSLNAASGVVGLNAYSQIQSPLIGPSLAPVTKRAPTAFDDSNHGYAAGNLWNVPNLGMWICVDAAAGAALWEPVPTGILPLDSVPGVTLHGWGTTRLRQAYSGNLLAVTPSGGTSTPIPQTSSGTLDLKALAAATGPVPAVSTSVTAPNSPQMWSVGVTTLYDQAAGGTTYDMTVPSADVAPQISPLYFTGNAPTIAFEDGGMNWFTDSATYAGNIQHPRLYNADMGATANNVMMMGVIRPGATGSSFDVLAAFGGTYAISYVTQNVTTSTLGASMVAGPTTDFNFYIPQTPSVYGINAGASATTAFDDDNGSYSGAAQLNYSNTGGLYFGGADTVNSGFSSNMSAFITGPALTAAQFLALRESLTDTLGLTPQIRDRVIVYGASTEAGADGWMGQSPAVFAGEQLKTTPFQIYNFAVAGRTVAPCGTSQSNSFNAVAMLNLTSPSVYKSYARNIFFLGEGAMINELGGCSVTAATTLADITTWSTTARALGNNVKVIVSSVAPHSSITTAQQQSINAAIAAAPSVYDTLMDLGGNAILGASTITSDRTMTITDGGHRSPYAQSMTGNLLASSINKLVLTNRSPNP